MNVIPKKALNTKGSKHPSKKTVSTVPLRAKLCLFLTPVQEENINQSSDSCQTAEQMEIKVIDDGAYLELRGCQKEEPEYFLRSKDSNFPQIISSVISVIIEENMFGQKVSLSSLLEEVAEKSEISVICALGSTEKLRRNSLEYKFKNLLNAMFSEESLPRKIEIFDTYVQLLCVKIRRPKNANSEASVYAELLIEINRFGW